MVRTPIALIPYLLAAAFTLSGYLWHVSNTVPAMGQVVSTGTAAIGGPFTLTDQDNATRRDTDFHGRFVLVFFGYTNCPDVCPTLLGVMDDVLGKLGTSARNIVPIFITTDPERDTPKVLKEYFKAFDAKFIGLTGSHDAIAQVANEYRVYIKKVPLAGGNYAVDHSSVIYLMGTDGKFVTFYDETKTPDDIIADLRKRL